MQVLFTVYRQEINITENTEPRKISKDKKKRKQKKTTKKQEHTTNQKLLLQRCI